MVYKKYVYKKGKRHGPYYYQSYRQDNHVKKVYIGGREEYKGWLEKTKEKIAKDKSRTTFQPFFSFMKNKSSLFIFIVVLAIFVGFLIYDYQITGKVSLEIKDSYTAKENITGVLKIGLKKGELLPIDSKIIISQNGFSKEIFLREIVSANFNGSFFLENIELSGEGEGYGFPGEKITYPTVFFKLKVYDIREKPEEKGEIRGEEITESSSKEKTEETRGEEITESSSKEKTEETRVAPIEEPAISTPPEMFIEEAPVDTTTEEALTEKIPLTGQAIEESVYYAEGSCSKEKPFIYEVEEGKTAELKQGSVEIEKVDEDGKTKKEKLEDGIVTLQISGNQVRVETDYSIIEQKFNFIDCAAS